MGQYLRGFSIRLCGFVEVAFLVTDRCVYQCGSSLVFAIELSLYLRGPRVGVASQLPVLVNFE